MRNRRATSLLSHYARKRWIASTQLKRLSMTSQIERAADLRSEFFDGEMFAMSAFRCGTASSRARRGNCYLHLGSNCVLLEMHRAVASFERPFIYLLRRRRLLRRPDFSMIARNTRSSIPSSGREVLSPSTEATSRQEVSGTPATGVPAAKYPLLPCHSRSAALDCSAPPANLWTLETFYAFAQSIDDERRRKCRCSRLSNVERCNPKLAAVLKNFRDPADHRISAKFVQLRFSHHSPHPLLFSVVHSPPSLNGRAVHSLTTG